jgi:hypothetical protein
MTFREVMFLLGGTWGGALLTFLFVAMVSVGKRADEEAERMIEAKRRGICGNE